MSLLKRHKHVKWHFVLRIKNFLRHDALIWATSWSSIYTLLRLLLFTWMNMNKAIFLLLSPERIRNFPYNWTSNVINWVSNRKLLNYKSENTSKFFRMKQTINTDRVSWSWLCTKRKAKSTFNRLIIKIFIWGRFLERVEHFTLSMILIHEMGD